MEKAKGWFKRYFIAEIYSTSLAVLLPMVFAGGNPVYMVALGVIGDNIGYYGYMFFNKYPNKRSLEKIKLMIFEFGAGEALDSFLLRPFFMGLALFIIPNDVAALVVGKLCADFSFYLPTILSYEFIVKDKLK